jgi:hypothetical protein
VIASGAFSQTWPSDDAVGDGVNEFSFESDTQLREIDEAVFSQRRSIREFTVPSSVETIGDRCFEKCSRMTSITFEDASRLTRIAKRHFAGSRLTLITIRASIQEIDGSTFVGGLLEIIRFALGNQKFIVEGNMLLTTNGTEIVRCFGRELKLMCESKSRFLGNRALKNANGSSKLFLRKGPDSGESANMHSLHAGR